MMFMSEEQKKIDDLYTKLKDLQEGKRVLENAMHHSYYNRAIYNGLYEKLKKLNLKIEEVKLEIAREKKS